MRRPAGRFHAIHLCFQFQTSLTHHPSAIGCLILSLFDPLSNAPFHFILKNFWFACLFVTYASIIFDNTVIDTLLDGSVLRINKWMTRPMCVRVFVCVCVRDSRVGMKTRWSVAPGSLLYCVRTYNKLSDDDDLKRFIYKRRCHTTIDWPNEFRLRI